MNLYNENLYNVNLYNEKLYNENLYNENLHNENDNLCDDAAKPAVYTSCDSLNLSKMLDVCPLPSLYAP